MSILGLVLLANGTSSSSLHSCTNFHTVLGSHLLEELSDLSIVDRLAIHVVHGAIHFFSLNIEVFKDLFKSSHSAHDLYKIRIRKEVEVLTPIESIYFMAFYSRGTDF